MSGEDRFAQYLSQAFEVQRQQISEASAGTYERYLKSYANQFQREFQADPFPITEDKAMAFIMKKKAEGETYATL